MRRLPRLFTVLAIYLAALHCVAFAVETKPVWLLSNGLHTSLAVRARDVPFRRKITGSARADTLIIGWGAADFYRGNVNLWTTLRATLSPSPSVIHVVPVRGPLARRFAHSDIIELALTPAQFHSLLAQLDAAFARDASGARAYLSPGYYDDSRFYHGRERFYFPKICNIWIAQRLRQSGLPICVPGALASSELIWQANQIGTRRQWLRLPVDGF